MLERNRYFENIANAQNIIITIKIPENLTFSKWFSLLNLIT